MSKNKLQAALLTLPPDALEQMLRHLRGGTSANWISDWLGRWGTPVSATTIKEHRRSL